ncbi:MAG: EMC3/TMCO1 family protein [Nanoarchaeota archaeon]
MNATTEAINETLGNSTVLLQNSTVPITGSLILDLFIISLIMAFFIALINKYLTDQVRIRALKQEVKDMRKKMTETMKKDPKKAQEIQRELMKKSMEQMKHSMNPKIMLITLIPALLIFTVIRKYYGPYGEFWDLGFTTFGWLGTYIIFSIVNSIIVRKIMKVA